MSHERYRKLFNIPDKLKEFTEKPKVTSTTTALGLEVDLIRIALGSFAEDLRKMHPTIDEEIRRADAFKAIIRLIESKGQLGGNPYRDRLQAIDFDSLSVLANLLRPKPASVDAFHHAILRLEGVEREVFLDICGQLLKMSQDLLEAYASAYLEHRQVVEAVLEEFSEEDHGEQLDGIFNID